MRDLLGLQTAKLATRWAGRPLRLVEHTSSTSEDAREAARAGAPQGYTVVADAQSAGRGRRGRAWHSPPGVNVYVSVVLRPALAVTDAPLLTLACGLAVRDTLAQFAGEHAATIKWPNDVRIAGRKVSGVLLEGSLAGERLQWAVAGIGINVRERPWPDELRESAGSLEGLCGAVIPRETVLRALFVALEARVDAVVAPATRAGVLAQVRAHCETLGQRVRIEGTEGVAEALADDGGLAVRGDDGALTVVRAGEVQMVRWEK